MGPGIPDLGKREEASEAKRGGGGIYCEIEKGGGLFEERRRGEALNDSLGATNGGFLPRKKRFRKQGLALLGKMPFSLSFDKKDCPNKKRIFLCTEKSMKAKGKTPPKNKDKKNLNSKERGIRAFLTSKPSKVQEETENPGKGHAFSSTKTKRGRREGDGNKKRQDNLRQTSRQLASGLEP